MYVAICTLQRCVCVWSPLGHAVTGFKKTTVTAPSTHKSEQGNSSVLFSSGCLRSACDAGGSKKPQEILLHKESTRTLRVGVEDAP